jgi:hypothetical protein
MYGRSFATHCLARDAESGIWCKHRPSDGVFCASHGQEFRCEEAAKVATRLARARLELEDPLTTPLRQWWAAIQVRRLQALRRRLLDAIERFEGPDADIVLAIEGPLPTDGPGRRR